LLDVSGVSNALTGYRKAQEFDATHQLARDRLDQEADFNNRRVGVLEQKASDEREKQERQRIAGIGQAIDAIQEPTQRSAAWQKFVGSHPAIAPLFKKYGQDPADHVNGPKFLLAEVQGPQDAYKGALTEQARAYAEAGRSSADLNRSRMEMEASDRLNAPQYTLDKEGNLTYAAFRPGDPRAGAVGDVTPAQSTLPGVSVTQPRTTKDDRRRQDVRELEPVIKGERVPSEAEIQRYWTGVHGQKASAGHKYNRAGQEVSNRIAGGPGDKGTRDAIKGALDSAQDNIDDARETLRGTNMVQRGLSYATDIGVAARVQGPIRIAIRGILHGISGAQINIPEQKEYFDAMLPGTGDAISTIEFKLNHIENTLKHIQRIQGAATDEDVVKVRNDMRKTLGLKPLSQEEAKKRLDERKPQDEKTRRLYEKYGLQ
jgi:hypothetical protein